MLDKSSRRNGICSKTKGGRELSAPAEGQAEAATVPEEQVGECRGASDTVHLESQLQGLSRG